MQYEHMLNKIARGSTARGVHRGIIEYLIRSTHFKLVGGILDIPCGRGEMIASLGAFFPQADIKGCDISKPVHLEIENFQYVDANNPFEVFQGKKFDLILSISGVMEFDNTLQFFKSCKNQLGSNGFFLVSNDNTVSIRDRLSFLLFGKVRQYSNFVNQGEPTWKVIPIHNMVRIIKDAGFDIKEIRYLSIKPKDWLMLPLACFIFPLQFMHRIWSRSTMAQMERHAMYPFSSLLFRHYFIVCQKVK